MSIFSWAGHAYKRLKAALTGDMDTEPTKPRIALRKGVHPDVRAAFEADPNVEVADDKPLPRVSTTTLLQFLGDRGFIRQPGKLRGHGYVQGETFDIGINRAKRAIKAIKNKRERKAARTRFIQRLRDSGIK